MKIDPNKPEEFLGMLETEAYNAGYDMDLNDPFHIVLKARDTSDPMPIIHAEYKDNGKYFWYTTHMEFPDRVDEGEYNGHFKYILDKWGKAAQVADYLVTHQWRIDEEWED